MASKTMTKPGGCGCGGSSGTIARGADSSGEVCSPCDDAAFVRPRFFAGQLLTEDDLEALTGYLTSKHRLHNSRLFGAGVVCGLEVTCGPCGGSKVIVKPGYALDCCGNDLVLSCERELDVNAMVLALQAMIKGSGDCTDPCAEKKPGAVSAPSARGHDAGRSSGERPAYDPSQLREYCLYVRYTEQQTEVVSTYPSGDDCERTSCEATRVRESVTFELRCPSEPPAEDLFTRIVDCVEKLAIHDRQSSDALSAQREATQLDQAVAGLDRKPGEFDAEELRRWRDAMGELGSTSGAAKDGDVLVRYAQLLVEIGGVYVRARHYAAEFEAVGKGIDLGRTREGLDRAATAIEANASSIRSRLDQQVARSAAQIWDRLKEPEVEGPPPERWAFRDRLYLRGALYDAELEAELLGALRGLRANLLSTLDCSGGSTTDCRLAEDAAGVVVPGPSPRGEIGQEDVQTVARAAHALVGLLLRSLADCICLALNPPCPPCDDPAVLLACVKVQQCEVVQVCNMERTFALTPTALRYWLPPLTWLGQLLEEACCNLGGLLAPSKVTSAERAEQLGPRTAFVARMLRHPSLELLREGEALFYGRAIHAPSVATTAVRLKDIAVARLPAAARSERLGPVAEVEERARDAAARLAELDARSKRQDEIIQKLSERLAKLEARPEAKPKERR